MRRTFGFAKRQSQGNYTPPDEFRHPIDTALKSDAMENSWVIAGTRGAGVTRLFEEYVRELKDSRIRSLKHFAVFVMDPHLISQFSAPDMLFNLRNTIVMQANLERRRQKKLRFSEADKHFIAFDSLWLAWFLWEFGPGVPPPHFALSSLKRLRKWFIKKGAAISIALVLDPISAFLNGAVEETGSQISIVGMQGISNIEGAAGVWAADKFAEAMEELVVTLRSHMSVESEYHEILNRLKITPPDKQNNAFWSKLLADALVPATRQVLKSFKDDAKALVLIDSADTLTAPACEDISLALGYLHQSLQDASIGLVAGGRLPDDLCCDSSGRSLKSQGSRIVVSQPGSNVVDIEQGAAPLVLGGHPCQSLIHHCKAGRLAILLP